MSSRVGARLALVAMLAPAAACGGPGPRRVDALHASGAADAGAADAASSGSRGGEPELPSLDAIAARGASDAPLMREVLRVERAAPRSPDVKADRDLCVRALYATAATAATTAAAAVRVSLVDQSGATRGEIALGASGAVPPRGPACITKGEAVHLVIEGGDGAARAVIFAAP